MEIFYIDTFCFSSVFPRYGTVCTCLETFVGIVRTCVGIRGNTRDPHNLMESAIIGRVGFETSFSFNYEFLIIPAKHTICG